MLERLVDAYERGVAKIDKSPLKKPAPANFEFNIRPIFGKKTLVSSKPLQGRLLDRCRFGFVVAGDFFHLLPGLWKQFPIATKIPTGTQVPLADVKELFLE